MAHDDNDFSSLLHPAQAFEHPRDVVNDPDLTLNEKRSILASWASDACAVEAAPELREGPGGARVKFDDIMDALRKLDGQMADTPKYRKLLRRAEIFKRIAGDRDGGAVPLQ
jgi:hypothetical protein